MIINVENKVENGAVDIKTGYRSIAGMVHIPESCISPEQSINLFHKGKVIDISPCDPDGSLYMISKEIGVLDGEECIFSMMFLSGDTALISVDNGSLCYRNEKGIYHAETGIGVRAIEDDKDSKISWLKTSSFALSLSRVLKGWSNQPEDVIDKYIANFIFTIAIHHSGDMIEYKIMGVDDSMVKPHGLVYSSHIELDFETDEIDEDEDYMGVDPEPEKIEDESEDEYEWYDESDDDDDDF